jgi:hypothetical protein
LARMGCYILGPFSYWVWRRSYPVFIPRKDTRERIARYIPECSFSTPIQTIKRAYVDDIIRYLDIRPDEGIRPSQTLQRKTSSKEKDW